MSAVEFQRVSCRGAFSSLDQLTFATGEGETTCILGPSGSGKTLIASIAAGLIGISGGSVRVLGQDPFHTDVAQRRCSFVFGSRAIPSGLFLDDFLLHASRLFRFSEDEARKALRLLDLYDIRHSRVSGLPPYRREIAKFLVPLCRKPDLLVVDGMEQKLDDGDLEFIYSRIFEVSKTAATSVLLTASRRKSVESFADRFLELRGGKITATTFVSSSSSQERFTLCKLRVSDVITGSKLLKAIRVEGNSIILREPADGLASAFDTLEKNGVQVLAFERLKEEDHGGEQPSFVDS